MAKKELPKASIGGTIFKFLARGRNVAKGIAKGAKTGYKTKIKPKPVVKTSTVSNTSKKVKPVKITKVVPKKVVSTTKTGTTGTTKLGTTKAGTTKTSTTSTTSTKETPSTPPTPKGKEPFVKSKGRLAFENVTGNVIGGAPFYTVNAVGKVLKNPIAQGIIGGATTAYVINKIAEGRRPVKIKKIKKK